MGSGDFWHICCNQVVWVPPNNSFKPTPHRGINSVLYATLHAVVATLWVGLTQALGGKKAFGSFSSQCSFSCLLLALLFGLFHAPLLLRSSSHDALIHHVRYVGWLRKRCLACSAFPQLTRLLRLHPAESSRVRARAFPLQFRQVRKGFTLPGFLRA